MRRRKEQMTDRSQRPFWILFFLVLFAAAGIIGCRMVLWKNADYMGEKLIQSYAQEEELNVAIYANKIQVAMAYINDQAAEGEPCAKMEEWITSYFEKTRESMNGNGTNAYAILDGKSIADEPWEGIETYDYENSVWYPQAMAARGEVIFTDAYTDMVDGKRVVTIAAANPETGNAVAFDLDSEDFQDIHQDLELLESSAYYLCDTTGEVLFRRAPFNVPDETVVKYVKELYRKSDSGELDASDYTIRDLDGKKRGVYYYDTSNGWRCILTIPFERLYENLYEVYVYYIVLAIAALVIMVLIWFHDCKMQKYIKDKNATIHMLGNSYYAIYRIKMENGTYEMTKGSEFVRQRLPYSGPYENLLSVLTDCMSEETGQDFAKSFSMDNIISLANKGTRDFGGDFQRLFGDEYRWVNVRLVQDPEHSPGEAVLCFREVEEKKKLQLQNIQLMESALASADASRRSQQQFFSNMSHDMRTPLNVIIGMADLGLRNDCSREKMEDYLQKISVSARQLLALINDILEMSRLEQGKIDLDNHAFNVCETLKLCVSPFEIQAQNEGKKFEVNVDVDSPIVCGDSLRLTQVLNNLISNAVKFTESGDGITVSLRQVKGSVHGRYIFSVQDTGAGMSEEFLPHLFEPYLRENRFGTRKVTGTGLGMPIVKNLVSQMGGEITVHSTLGEGTRINIMLPFSVSSSEPVAQKEENDYGNLVGRHILLAEDNPLNREIVMELLSLKGMEVTIAENGREALEKFAESEEFFFDAILMDVQMPEMDGCEATGIIRALKRADAKSILIIALTANAFPEDIAHTAAAGMNTHLCKPVEPEMLWAALQQT